MFTATAATIVRDKLRGKRFFSKTNEEKLQMLEALNSEFNTAFNRSVKLQYADDIHSYHMTGGGETDGRHITLYHKVSLMTFLHEWGHILYGRSEDAAVMFSHSVFYQSFPKTYQNSRVKRLFHHYPDIEVIKAPSL